VVQSGEEIIKHYWQLLVNYSNSVVVRVVVGLVFIVLNQQFSQHSLHLLFRHGTEVEVDEHILIKDVCVLFKDLDLLDETVVDHNH